MEKQVIHRPPKFHSKSMLPLQEKLQMMRPPSPSRSNRRHTHGEIHIPAKASVMSACKKS
jgi:hypothetical protein